MRLNPMKQFFLTMAGVFAGLILFFVVVPFLLIVMAISSASSSAPVPSSAVLELDLREGLTDQAPSNPFAAFGGGGLSTVEIVQTLGQAAEDDHVKVLLVRLPEGGMSPAAADELRQAFRRFRQAGKRVIAHSQSFMPVGASISSYMLGAASGELWMQNTSSFQVTGLATQELFLGGALEKYGVTADFEQRYEYKNAVNTLNQSDFTAAHREALTSWMSSIYANAIAAAATDRRVEPQALRATLEAGPYSAEEALRLKLIDKIGQVEEAEAAAKAAAGKNAEIIEFADYQDAKGQNLGSGRNAIAIVGGEGAIVTGKTKFDPFGGGAMKASDDIAEAIYDAIEDDAVKAIVFRVSSPGGSPDASEQILAAVRAAKKAGKPVVVSMGDYAASGGYWVASEASWIVAQPTTITGSIGVFGGKFVLDEALNRFGLNMSGVSIGGEYADAMTPERPFNAAERAEFSAWMDGIYEDFITRVSAGRKLPAARVREIARGRVWTGAQAKELGLVDELGGLNHAIARAKILAKLPADEAVRFKRYPEQMGTWEALSEAFGVSGEAARALIMVGALTSQPEAEAAMEEIRAQRLRSRGSVVLADTPAY